jgi:uncharacterized protein (TIGR03435 family)
MMLRVLSLLWDGIAPALKNHLWQSTFFLLLAAVLTLALRRNHARARYWLWLAASIKFLVPFSLLVALGSHINLPHRPAAPAQAGIYIAVDELSEPFVPGVDAPVAAPLAALSATGWDMEHVLPRVLAAVWFAGFAIILSVWTVYWRRVAAAVRHAVPIGEGRELATLRRLEQLGGVRAPTRLALSPASMEPGIFGIARPVLIWPRGMSARLDDAHLEAILAHEVCHVRRRDNLTAAVHMLVEAIFWFHPLVWWLGARLVEERERACDEEVLRLCNRPEVYAEGILKVCEFCLESPLPCVSGVTGSDLKKRIANVLAAHVSLRMGLGKQVLLVAVALMAIAAPIVLGQVKAAQRMMLALTQVSEARPGAPGTMESFRAAAHALIAEEQTLSTGEIAEVQADGAAGPPKQSLDGAPGDEELGPAFEVATIRPANRDDGRHWFGARLDASGKFTTSAEPLSGLVWTAYIHAQGKGKVSGGPKWAQSDSWDINAKVDDAYMAGWDKLTDEQRMDRVRPMIRRLLSDRFHLKLKIETLPTPVYALVQAKGGAHVKEVPAPEPLEGDPMEAPLKWMADNPGKAIPGGIICSGHTCTGKAVRISDAIGQITGSSRADRIVIDETGLKGYYDLAFTQPENNDDSAMAEIEDDLGMKFEPRTVPMKTYTIDSAEKPSVDGAEVPAASIKPIVLVLEKAAQTNAAGAASTDDPTGGVRFDVVSIKLNKTGKYGGSPIFPDDGDSMNLTNMTLEDILKFDYAIHREPGLVGLPDWAGKDRYDIQAKVAASDVAAWRKLSGGSRRLVLRAMLADSFKLKVHTEDRDLPVYALVLDKNGPKNMQEVKAADFDPDISRGRDGAVLGGWASPDKSRPSRPGDPMVAHQMSMGYFLFWLNQMDLGRPIYNQTGLNGNYNFTLQFAPEQISARANAAVETDSAAGPSIFTALQDQLGLKLQPAKGPVTVMVVDHIERPPEN